MVTVIQDHIGPTFPRLANMAWTFDLAKQDALALRSLNRTSFLESTVPCCALRPFEHVSPTWLAAFGFREHRCMPSLWCMYTKSHCTAWHNDFKDCATEGIWLSGLAPGLARPNPSTHGIGNLDSQHTFHSQSLLDAFCMEGKHQITILLVFMTLPGMHKLQLDDK